MKTENISSLVADAQKRMLDSQTDLVCLVIEHNPDLLQRYLRAIGEYGGKTGWKKVNMQIGKCVKEKVVGKNNRREYRPMSILLQSYTRINPLV